MTPLAIDLYCGLGGWTEGLLAEGYRVIGFDIEQHVYGEHRYPAQLVLQDVLTLHGSQFKDAALIVASPPCQEYSYMAMPWSLAKEKQRRIKADPAEQKRLTALFDACFRIQREACEAAGHHIPLVVENVRGAQKWVGRAHGRYGSYFLWGDVSCLMPTSMGRFGDGSKHVGSGPEWFNPNIPTPDKMFGQRGPSSFWSSSPQRREWSAKIAKIPPELSTWIAKYFKPTSSPIVSQVSDTSASQGEQCRSAGTLTAPRATPAKPPPR